MTNLFIDVTDLGGEAHPGDRVILWKPEMKGSAVDVNRVVSTAPVTATLHDGKATIEGVEPGDMRVLLQCRGIESQVPIDVVVPDTDTTVAFRSLLESQYDYEPPVVSAVQNAVEKIASAERDVLGAHDRIETWASEVEGNAAQSVNSAASAKTSEVNALSAAERAEFAAEETIQQVEGDFATRNYADSKAWIRRSLQLNEDLNTVIDPGIYTSYLGSMTSGLGNRPTGFVHPGYMEVTTSGGGVVFQRFTQRNSSGETSSAMRSRNASGEWAGWQHIASGGDPLLRGTLPTGTDMNTVTGTGIYLSPLFSITSSLVNHVPGTDGIPSGVFIVHNAGSGLVSQRWEKISSVNQRQAVYRRHQDLQGNWSAWEDITPGSPSGAELQSTAELSESTARAEMLRQTSRLRRGRVVGTSGATPVALSFDHGTTNFRNLILPHLIRLGLPCSLAFMPDGLGTTGDDATWEELQTWSLNHGVELAHHARSHGDVADALDNLPALEHQLLSSIDEAETNMPEAVADAFIMPGVSDTGYNGFTGGISDPSLLYTHPAGRMILSNFPVITWGMPGQAIPMTGEPVQFVDRIGIDTASFATLAQNKITSLRGTGMGISVFMHPSYLTVDGRITESRLVSFLEWLAAERAAGRVEVLTVSGFAYADSGSSRRVDLAPADAWTSHYHTIEIDPLRNWAQGSQAVLETTAHVSGDFTLSATSDTGGLAASRSFTGVVTGDRLRLAFSIPRNAKSITLHAYGNDRSCKIV